MVEVLKEFSPVQIAIYCGFITIWIVLILQKAKKFKVKTEHLEIGGSSVSKYYDLIDTANKEFKNRYITYMDSQKIVFASYMPKSIPSVWKLIIAEIISDTTINALVRNSIAEKLTDREKFVVWRKTNDKEAQERLKVYLKVEGESEGSEWSNIVYNDEFEACLREIRSDCYLAIRQHFISFLDKVLMITKDCEGEMAEFRKQTEKLKKDIKKSWSWFKIERFGEETKGEQR